MKFSILFPLVAICLIGCGKSEQKNEPLPHAAPPISPAPTPAPATPPASSLKWSATQIEEQTNACAERGVIEYTISQWKVFCRCTYVGAAEKWSFDYFQENFEESYTVLYDNGTIQSCLTKAGIN